MSWLRGRFEPGARPARAEAFRRTEGTPAVWERKVLRRPRSLLTLGNLAQTFAVAIVVVIAVADWRGGSRSIGEFLCPQRHNGPAELSC